MLKRILITGTSEFVCTQVLRAFRDVFASAELLGIGRRVSPEVLEEVDYETLDLIDPAAVARRLRTFWPTDVLHLAAESSVICADKSKFETWYINFGALYNLIDAIKRTGESSTFAFVSSSEAYGRAFIDGCPASAQTIPEPMNAYARSKWLGEQLLLKSTDGTCLKLIVLRPSNHIGPGQSLAFAVASFAQQIALTEAGRRPPLVEVGNLSAQRDFIDVSDVVAAYSVIRQRAKAFDGPQIFNICSGQPRNIASILMGLRALSRVPFEIRSDPARKRQYDVPLAFGDARHLQQAKGWAPKVDETSSLARILDDARIRDAVAES